MKRQPRILAGTAIGLLMASAPLGAFPLQNAEAGSQRAGTPPLVLIQSDCPEGQSAEACANGQAEPDAKGRKKKERQQQAEPAPAEQAAPAEEAAPAAEPEQKPRRKKDRQEQAEQPAPAEQAAPAEEAAPAAEPEQKPRRKKDRQEQAEQPAPAEQAAPAEEAAPAAEPEQKPRRKKDRQEQAEQPAPAEQAAPAEQPAPAQEAAPQPEPEPNQAERAPAQGEQPADQAAEPKSSKEKLRQFLKKKQAGGEEEQAEPQQAEEPAAPAEGKQAEKPKAAEEGQPAEQAAPATAPEQNAGEQPAPGAEQPAPGANQAEGEQAQPVLPGNLEGGKQRRQERVKDQAEANPLPENAAPVLDSAKGAVPAGEQGQNAEQAGQPPAEQQQGAAAEAPPPPESDAAAQEVKIAPADIQSLLVEKGERFEPATREERREFRRERRERRQDAQVIKEFNDNRTIIEINNHVFIDSPDYDRIILDDDRVYYDDLPNNRTREVIIRPNGSRVITVRNRYGDIIRRSRITRDGREILLVYVPDDRLDRVAVWEDPGADLPPLQLNVPVSSYILEADTVEDPDRYYTFLEQPPIAEIDRIYSVDEVKRSARLRDTMPRIDLDTINFETGSAEIGESEVDELDAIAQAILRVLEDNPGETFLIEGHTDAVGSDESNLVLSDRRAEAVAEALTSVYEIPPENLVTQGYGEQYLKVNTEGASRENRRVAMRRITPLVAPVAQNQ